MGFRFPSSLISNAKRALHINNKNINHAGFHKLKSVVNDKNQARVPKGHVAIYVGDMEKKRYVIPISYLSHPLFQDLLRLVEEEYGFDHQMGGLTIIRWAASVLVKIKTQEDNQ